MANSKYEYVKSYEVNDEVFLPNLIIVRIDGCDFQRISETNDNGSPVRRLRRKSSIVHSKNIADRRFWNKQAHLQKELGSFTKDIEKVEHDYIRSFQFEDKLIPSTWVVVRIDGCHFHRFSEVHEFVKPNDEQAINLMNSCAVAVLQEFQELVFSYGVSDEYRHRICFVSELCRLYHYHLLSHCSCYCSFVLKKDSQFCQRQASEMVSVFVSFFTSMYVMKWKDFFLRKELKYPPCFDGRAVCYPSYEILRDYLSWRQVDCHINNQYNTCFWELVKSGKTKTEAQKAVKGTQTGGKEKLLRQFGIEYNELPVMFRCGSSAFWGTTRIDKNGECNGNSGKRVVVEHCNIIEASFWDALPTILSG
ncbi:tRNA(His) guanylyltransferase 1-like [Pyrus communis]|uniref:tRNA(His) guanylyltransferase 1-like n=1 Tax=Pyrus communis TaxID=23211 RepID=UPI0035C190ED